MQDLINELNASLKEANDLLDEMKEAGSDHAQKERDYRVAQRHLTLELRAQGIPVTILSDLTRGEEHIAELRLKRDAAKTLYEATKEAINVKKLTIRVLDNQIQREWGAREPM